MIRYLSILALFFAVTFTLPAFAQNAAPAPTSKEVTVNSEELKKLITTLESETGRTDFITNLKTLAETQAKPAEGEAPEESIAPLTKTLGVDSFTNRIFDQYQGFLQRNDLKGSTVGKLTMTLLITLLGVGIIFALRRGATKMLYWFDRAVDWMNLPATRMRLYTRVLRAFVTLGIMGLMLYTYTLIWNMRGQGNVFESHWFKTAIGLLINISFVVVLATVAWEAINAVMQVTFRKIDGNNSARAKTIMPIVRNVLFIVFAVLFTLVLLSEIGINILPLLAGAGIVGVAVGFGAQNMVKDFLSGFTLILEDVLRVGDVVRMDQWSGTVEKITLRKVQLRGAAGTVFTIPFSAIQVIENMTKDFSSYDFTFTIPFETDADKAFGVLREVSEGMQNDPAFGDLILEPIDIWGVDGINENGVIIKGKIKTVAGKQWAVQREFNRRKKIAFEAHNIPNAAVPRSFQVTETITQAERSAMKAAKAAEKPAS